MKIFFRYLFMRLLQPFMICMAAFTVIWVMADLYGNMDDFLDHKVNLRLVSYFYLLQLPKMLVQVLPAAMLFSALFTLLSLNRRSELVALQSGGMAPLWMFSPFFLFTAIWIAILAYDMSGPAAVAEVTRERILRQVKGEAAGRNVFENLPYVDSVNHLVWFFHELDINRGRAKGVELLQRDAQGHDILKYFARQADWKEDHWVLHEGKKDVYAVGTGDIEEKTFTDLDLPDITTPPKQLSLIVSQPPQLTVSQLSDYIKTSSQTHETLAKYRTEWWDRVIYPFSLLVLVLFALVQGTRTDRRSAVAGVFSAIFVLLGFMMLKAGVMAMGQHDRLPPVVAASATEVIFGAVGMYMLAVRNGWWWQVRELWKHWFESDDDEKEEPVA